MTEKNLMILIPIALLAIIILSVFLFIKIMNYFYSGKFWKTSYKKVIIGMVGIVLFISLIGIGLGLLIGDKPLQPQTSLENFRIINPIQNTSENDLGGDDVMAIIVLASSLAFIIIIIVGYKVGNYVMDNYFDMEYVNGFWKLLVGIICVVFATDIIFILTAVSKWAFNYLF